MQSPAFNRTKEINLSRIQNSLIRAKRMTNIPKEGILTAERKRRESTKLFRHAFRGPSRSNILGIDSNMSGSPPQRFFMNSLSAEKYNHPLNKTLQNSRIKADHDSDSPPKEETLTVKAEQKKTIHYIDEGFNHMNTDKEIDRKTFTKDNFHINLSNVVHVP